MKLASHVPTRSSSAKSPIASKSPWILIATVKLESKMRRNSKSNAASSSQARLQDAYLGWVDRQSHRETCRNKWGTRRCGPFWIWNWEWRKCDRETGCLKNSSGETQCIQLNQTAKISPKAEKTKWSQSTRVTSHSSSHGGSLLDRQQDLRTITWRPFEWFGFENGLSGHISEYYSSSSSSSWTRPWREFTLSEESSLEQCGTVIPLNLKTDKWTTRNHWCKQYRFPRCYVDVDKLIVWKGLPDHQRQSLRLLLLCALCGKKEKWSCCDLERAKLNGIRKNNHFKDTNRRNADGVRVENIPRNHGVGPPREDSKSNERLTV